MNRPQIVDFTTLRGFSPAAGVHGKPLFGDQVQLTLVEFAPGAAAPIHTHPQEQLSIVLRGTEILIVDGDEHELHALHGYAMPSGHPHGARAGRDGALVLEVFHPLRQDYQHAAHGITTESFT